VPPDATSTYTKLARLLAAALRAVLRASKLSPKKYGDDDDP
jgi:hypothetical protein